MIVSYTFVEKNARIKYIHNSLAFRDRMQYIKYMSDLASGTTGADVDRTVEDSPEQRPCKGCGEDPGNCTCEEECDGALFECNQNQLRGRSTGQHEQREQQAGLFAVPTAPARIEITAESAHLLQGAVDSFFEHYDRIELLAPGEWREQINEANRQAAADHEEAASEFWSDLEIEGSGV